MLAFKYAADAARSFSTFAFPCTAAILAASSLGSPANAGSIARFEWRVVDNTAGGAALADFITVDLFLIAESDFGLNGCSFGHQGSPIFSPGQILTDGAFFNSAFGGNLQPNPLLFDLVPELEFDTYLTISGADPSLFGGEGVTDLVATDGSLNGTVLTIPPLQVLAGDEVQFGRFSLNRFTSTYIGGDESLGELGLSSNVSVNIAIPLFVVPAPGAASVLAIAGFVATRRRR